MQMSLHLQFRTWNILTQSVQQKWCEATYCNARVRFPVSTKSNTKYLEIIHLTHFYRRKWKVSQRFVLDWLRSRLNKMLSLKYSRTNFPLFTGQIATDFDNYHAFIDSNKPWEQTPNEQRKNSTRNYCSNGILLGLRVPIEKAEHSPSKKVVI